MLLDYHSYYEERAPAPAPAWEPRRRKAPERVRREPLPEPVARPEPVVGSVDVTLPMLAVEIAATASTIPPTPITEIDLDTQDGGWTDERLLIAAAQLLLEEDED